MGGLFGGAPSFHTEDPIIAAMRINTSAYGKAIALCYGKTRVAGNLIWYNDFTAIPHTETSSGGGKGGGGGGGSSRTSYTYTAAAIMGLCEGQINGIGSVWAGKEQNTASGLGLSSYAGTASQVPFGYVTTNHPGEALGYRRLAYVATGAYDLGDNASLPNHTFEVDGLLPFSAGIRDALPSDILVDYLSDAHHGAGFPAGKIGNLTQWANYCTAAGLFLSPAYTAQEQASEALARLFQCGNAAPFFSEGVLKVVPYGDTPITGNGVTYTPSNTAQYALTDDDFLGETDDPVIVLRGNPADAFNQVQVKYTNRLNQYNDDVVEAKDQANIELYGLRPMQPIDLGDICDINAARAVAQIALQRSLYIRNTYRFTVGWKYCLLEPMDIVTLTEDSGTGLSNVAVRITSIEESEDGAFSVEAEDFVGGIASHVAYPTQQAGGYSGNYNISPGSVNPPVIFDAPGRMTDSGFEVWFAVAGADPNWGGANVYVSTDGSTYALAGSIASRSRYGYLSAPMNSGADPDATNTAAVDLTTSLGALVSGTATDADLLNTLCYCDGELFSYQTATLTASNKYTLGTRLRRGVYGTPIASHASGKGFVRLDGALGRYAYDPAMVGRQIWIKFCSFNIYGAATESINNVTPYSYTISGPIGAPADVSGTAATPTSDGIVLSWAASATPNLKQYEVRLGAVWSTATPVGKSLTTRLLVPAVATGNTTWLVKAIDDSGRESVNAAAIVLSVSAPTAPTVTAQVIDNNVLLFWTASVGTQAIQTYEVRRGATWATAAVIGTKTGLFTNVFETNAGTYTYWVAAIDIGGNYGAPASTTTTVSAPPDYVLKASVDSIFGGTKSNAILELGKIVMPVNTTETFAQHFTARAWSTPQDQVNAGYPIYAQPAGTSGYYEEIVDYGTQLAACKVTASFAGTVLAGVVTPSCTITVAQDAGFTTGVQTFAGATQAYGTNFRYAKVRITATGAGGANLYRLDSLNIRLDVKLKNDAGTVTWNGNPATAAFNLPFIDVSAINLTVMGSTGSIVAVTDFVDVPNPTTFKVYLFNSTTGAPPTGPITVAWSAKGY